MADDLISRQAALGRLKDVENIMICVWMMGGKLK